MDYLLRVNVCVFHVCVKYIMQLEPVLGETVDRDGSLDYTNINLQVSASFVT
jgi:hypothetical protein